MGTTNKLELKNLIKNYDWYHTIELTSGIVTKGRYDWRKYFKNFNFPSLKGKKILDVGAGNGFFSFEFEKQGGIVTALEIPHQEERDNYCFGEKNISISKATQIMNFQEPFNIAKKALNSKVKTIRKDIYKMNPEEDGYYDLIFCNDVLLHLTDPFRALCALRNICKDMLIIGTCIYVHRIKLINSLLNKAPLSYFKGHTKSGVFWFPNLNCLESMLNGAGFVIKELSVLNLNKRHAECYNPRGIAKCCINTLD